MIIQWDRFLLHVMQRQMHVLMCLTYYFLFCHLFHTCKQHVYASFYVITCTAFFSCVHLYDIEVYCICLPVLCCKMLHAMWNALCCCLCAQETSQVRIPLIISVILFQICKHYAYAVYFAFTLLVVDLVCLVIPHTSTLTDMCWLKAMFRLVQHLLFPSFVQKLIIVWDWTKTFHVLFSIISLCPSHMSHVSDSFYHCRCTWDLLVIIVMFNKVAAIMPVH